MSGQSFEPFNHLLSGKPSTILGGDMTESL